jgi:peptidoglycan/xylan/chitin deacetylase (PgdA/CDA1 family)
MITEKQVESLAPERARDATESLRKVAGSGWILTYHEVEPGKSNYIYAVSARQLDEQVKFIAERNKGRQEITELTFDDGHVSNFEVAKPVLEKYGLKATFFVTAGRPGIHPQTMSWAQLRALVDRGHSVQSHGWSHKFLIHCSPTELRDELSRSKRELEEQTGAPVEAISVPGGRWNTGVLRAAAEAGYRRVYTSDFWRKKAFREGVHVAGRFMVRSDMSVAQIERWISMDVDSLRMLRAKHTVKNAVRRVTGDRLYHKLWCWLAVSKPEATDEENG